VQSTDTPTNNHCTLNPLDPRTAGTLSNGNLTTTGDAVVTLRPSEGKWSYKKDGAEQLYDADVSGQFDPVLAAGTYTFAGYTPTSGYKLLTAANLPEPDVLDTSLFADIVLREGTGADVAIDSLKFPPDWVNIKIRNAAYAWRLFDTARGVLNALRTDINNAEEILPEGLKSFDPNGYTLGSHIDINKLSSNYVDLALLADPAIGFEIHAVSHTTGTPTIINHTLGKPVTFAITKQRTGTQGWWTYHPALGADTYQDMHATDAAISRPGVWPVNTSTQFALGTPHATGEYIVYLFTDSDVFKSFSFTGNGSADGPFIDLGGRLLSIPFFKNTSVDSGWMNYDAVRSTDNPLDLVLRPDDPYYEQTVGLLSAHSTGFKAISGGSSGWPLTVNGNGGLIIGLAILRQPQKYANAF
jgi:hypothetical protein